MMAPFWLPLQRELERNRPQIERQHWPPDVCDIVRCAFDDIADRLGNQGAGYDSSEDDLYEYDLRIARFRRVPLGSLSVERSAFARRWLLQPGRALQAAVVARYLIREVGGHGPMFEFHLTPNWRAHLTESERHQVLVRLAGLVRSEPEIRGVFGASWYYDPAMEDVSPHLAFLRRQLINAGASCIEISDRRAKEFALTSEGRRDAFRRGVYRPATHACVLSRKHLLEAFG